MYLTKLVFRKLRLCVILLFAFFFLSQSSFSQNAQNTIIGRLAEDGFENLRIQENSDSIILSFENNRYRWDVDGIDAVFRHLETLLDTTKQVHLILNLNDIPQLSIQALYQQAVGQFQWNTIRVNPAKQKYWQTIRHKQAVNSNKWKFDLIAYPQFALRNTSFHKLYEVQLNFAPALQFSAWRGMSFIAQLIIPIHNDLGYYGDWVRPGFIVINQNWRLSDPWQLNLSLGNFNNYRYGGQIQSTYRLKNPAWSINLSAGISGYSYFHKSYWDRGKLNNFTWDISTEYFWSYYNMQFELGIEQYIHEDMGLRFDFTRHFRDVAIGFYATYIEEKINGGFHFAIPIAPKKRALPRRVQFRLPAYFDWEYNARTDFYKGSYFESNPYRNRSKNYLNPTYIQTQLIHKHQ